MGQTSSTDVLAVLYVHSHISFVADRIWSPGLSRLGIFGKLRKGQAAEKADGIDGQLARKDDCSRSGWFLSEIGDQLVTVAV